MRNIFLTLISVFFLLACDGELAVMSQGRLQDKNKMLVASLDRLAARPGDQVSFSGQNLKPEIQIFVNDRPIPFTFIDQSRGMFVLPDDIKPGLQQIVFKHGDESISKQPLMNGESIDDLPILPIAEDFVCDSFIFKNQKGHLYRGSAECQEPIPACVRDGQINCEPTADFPAVMKTGLSAKLAAGQSLIGIPSQESCEGDSVLELKAKLVGGPLAKSESSALHVGIAGDGITQYKYKVRSASEPSCTDPQGYSESFTVDNPIATNVAGKPNGLLELCVLGMDASGQWQDVPSTSIWTKNAPSPTAVFSGEPVGSTLSSLLNVDVSATDLSAYKYKIRQATDSPCSDSAGYSSERPAGSPISQDLSGFGEGRVELCVIGRNAQGKWQAEMLATSSSWTIDTTPPIATLADVPQIESSSTNLAIKIAGDNATHYRYKIREAGDPPCSDIAGYGSAIPVSLPISDSLSALPDGVMELCVISRDGAGNWQNEAGASGISWTKDTTAPIASLSGAPSGTSNASALSISVAGADVSHYRYKLRDGSDASCSNPADYSSERPISTAIANSLASWPDGVIELCVIGRDSTGNWQEEGSATSITWTKDSLPPAASLSGSPTGNSLVTSLNISVAGTDVVQYKYKIRAGSDPGCSDSSAYSGAIAISTPISDAISALPDASLQVCVVGRDAAGNWQLEGTATIASWTKDTTSPVASINGAPSGTNSAATLNVTISAADLTHYHYKVRAAGDSACSSSAGYSSERAVAVPINDALSGFADGSLELCVIGRDGVGNWQPESAASSRTWIKDTAAPTATLSGVPAGTSNSTLLALTIAGAGVSHYKFKLREAATSACSHPSGYSAEAAVSTLLSSDTAALADGVLQICVIGRDAAGNWQTAASATTASWAKDTLPSSATLSGAPAGNSLATTLNITVAGTDIVQYKYKIRESVDAACSLSTGYSTALSVATPITDSIASLADGSLQVCVVGQDSSGNWQPEGISTNASWTKDTLAPTATISGAPSVTNSSSSLNVSIAGTDVTHYRYRLRETADPACSNSSGYSAPVAVANAITSSLSTLVDGVIELCVIGRDATGNWQAEASAAVASWTKDTAAPVASISGAPTGTNPTKVLNVTIAGAGVSHYKYKLREAADTPCSNAAGYSAETAVANSITSDYSSLPDGAFELCVVGRDVSGNWQAEASATAAAWTKDTLPPAAALSGVPTGTSLAAALDITVSGTDVVQYKYKLREAADSVCSHSSGYSLGFPAATHISDSIAALPDGVLEVCVIGQDGAGNWQLEGTSTSASWTKDTLAPTATISNAPSGTNNSASLNVSIAGTDVTHYKFKIREAADIACSNSTGYSAQVTVASAITSSLSGLADGTIELCVIGRDAAGNWQSEASAATASWTKDASAPTATLTGAPTGSNSLTSLNVTIAGSGVTHYKYKVREAADAACSDTAAYSAETAIAIPITASLSLLADGSLELCVIGRDSVGNWQSEAAATAATWTKDTMAPSATVSGAPSGTSNASALSITIGGTGVTEYRYKIRTSTDSACSLAAGYSGDTAIATLIGDSISALSDGTIEVCVVGRDSAGNWQAEANAASVSWTKDTAAPTATIADAPSAMNATTLLDVSIAGSDVTHYKYKLRASADAACSASAAYSAETAVATKIGSDISAMADGSIELCVIGRDAAGNWQAEASAAASSWIKNTVPPTATLSGQATGTSSATTLNVTVAGTYVSHYKYKLRAPADAACSDASGYSAERAIASLITDDISALGEGTIEICVVGRGITNIYQSYAAATRVSWQKDALLPTAPTAFSVSPRETSLRAYWTSGGGDVSGFIVLRRAATTISDSPGTGASYSIGQTIGSSTVAYIGNAASFVDSSLANGTKYYYRIFAYDAALNYSSGLIAWGRPVSYEPPAADSLLFWTDASYSDSFFLEDTCATAVTAEDEAVGCMKDLTSTGATLVQATGGNRPVYKTGVIRSSPGLRHSDSHWLKAASSNLPSGNQEHTLVFIGDFANTTSSSAIHIGSNSNDAMIKLWADSNQIIYAFGNNDLRYAVPSSATAKLYFGTYNAVDGSTANRKFYINNTESSSVASTGTLTNTLNLPSNPSISLGSDSTATQSLSGDAGEFLLYNKVLSANECTELSRYAWNKWGIPQIELSTTSLLSGITLNWTDGVGSSSYLIVRHTGDAPTFVPSNGVAYGLGAQGADEIVYTGTAKTYTHSSPTEGLTYSYALYGNDGSHNYTPVVETEATVLKTPSLSASVDDAKLHLSWSSVTEAVGYLLVRQASTNPTFVPSDGLPYTAGAQGADTVVYVGNANSLDDNGLTNATTYYYKLYAYDSALNYADATATNAAPVGSCSTTTTTVSSSGTYSVPSGCTSLIIKAWGGGGGGASRVGSANSGNGGGGGSASKTLGVNGSTSISITIGNGGTCSGTAGTGYASGGAGGAGASGAIGGGTGTGGNGGSGGSGGTARKGGNGKYGGGGGGGNSSNSTVKGAGGGGATSVSIDGVLQVVAGGGGGGGAQANAGTSGSIGGNGGAGCALAGGNSGGVPDASGGGGGGGACLGTATANGSGKTPGDNANVPSGKAAGGTWSTGTCGASNDGKAGAVTLTFSP